MSDLIEGSNTIQRAKEILNLIKNLQVTLNPESERDCDDVETLQRVMSKDVTNEEEAQMIIRAYDGLVAWGRVKLEEISLKDVKELRIKVEILEKDLENEKELRFKAEGRLDEYRRRYEDGKLNTFTSEVTEDESP